ncbi:MAG: AAA domain-containing protein [Clostridiales bacterium]|nr:AAA domain-containing protein [Clostridiales bacterium]
MLSSDVNDNLRKVLDYWYVLEFLSQKGDAKDLSATKIKVNKQKIQLSRGKSKPKPEPSLKDYLPLEEGSDSPLSDRLISEAEQCGMGAWGNLTIYLGQIPRENCIDVLRKKLPYDSEAEKTPEKNQDQIACLSLQLSPSGVYVEHSLSLSPVLWAATQVYKASRTELSTLLNEQLYREEMRALEEKYFTSEKALDSSVEDASEEQTVPEENSVEEFSPLAVTEKTLWNLLRDIEQGFVNTLFEGSGESSCLKRTGRVEFQLFLNAEVRAERDEDTYTGLSDSYYANDLAFLMKDWVGNENVHPYMQQELCDYVLSPHRNFEANRRDLVRKPAEEQDRRGYHDLLSHIFDVLNAPLGKWPSRYMPAFMQQAAINLALGKVTENTGEACSRIFSVNGPPGTGKTTLLKEIIVSNIVDRAILLSEYEKSDDAFVSNDFSGGAAGNPYYDKYIRHWYSLKNDRINDYGILVASCNNAAVENISKELPVSMVKDLSPADGDFPELVDALEEVADLFAPGDSDDRNGVYFTSYAQALLGDSNQEAWGLISAPLGKKTNLSRFYRQVMKPLKYNMRSNDLVAAHEKKYIQARSQFLAQLEKVKDYQKRMRTSISVLDKKSTLERELTRAQKQLEDGKTTYIQRCGRIANDIQQCNHRLQALKLDYADCLSRRRDVQSEFDKVKADVKKLQAEKKSLLSKALSVQNSVSLWEKIFDKRKYAAAAALAEEYTGDAARLGEHISAQEARLQELQLRLQALSEEKRSLEAQISQQEDMLNRKQRELVEEDAAVDGLEKRRFTAQTAYDAACADCDALAMRIAQNPKDHCVLLDDKFLDQLFSENTDVATKAQVANPWMTELYNREREKLFALAMRMNQEFILSSKSLRDNYKTLAQYWRLEKNNDKEMVTFSDRDRATVVPALFQSLFLLVPVISTTFASVATMFKDVKTAGSFGLLIVDEAGQAPPQMALGALYRCRRAMIVGDPRQVEPVVTDDLLLLKKAYADPDLAPYKSKTLSVQTFADAQNRFGTYLSGANGAEWVGCPLLVHRRCISPMYDISNQISYNNIMKQQTREPKDVSTLTLNKSQWINVVGNELGSGNHFVEAQGKKVCELLDIAFSKSNQPSLFIISPFTTVVSGIKKYIKEHDHGYAQYMLDDEHKRIGTVHTFQGREASEVILLLGCDRGQKSKGAIRWVNENIVNVAATRAKYRLYVIDDAKAWEASDCVSAAKTILDTFAIRRIAEISNSDLDGEERKQELLRAIDCLPSITSFTEETVAEDGTVDYNLTTGDFAQGLNSFIDIDLTEERMKRFGFQSMKELDNFSPRVKENLIMGIKSYYFFESLYTDINRQLDAATCAIWFCKAFELHMKDCFCKPLARAFPEFTISGKGKGRGKVALKDVNEGTEMTLGTIAYILKQNSSDLPQKLQTDGARTYDESWWRSFENKLSDGTNLRNRCCHSGAFTWKDQSFLLFDMFLPDTDKNRKNRKQIINGLMFDSQIVKKAGK